MGIQNDTLRSFAIEIKPTRSWNRLLCEGGDPAVESHGGKVGTARLFILAPFPCGRSKERTQGADDPDDRVIKPDREEFHAIVSGVSCKAQEPQQAAELTTGNPLGFNPSNFAGSDRYLQLRVSGEYGAAVREKELHERPSRKGQHESRDHWVKRPRRDELRGGLPPVVL